jgi:hypothetical protein
MLDPDARLRGDTHLLFLLEHYTAPEDRETWQDRVMQIEGAEPASIVRLHGELLAYGWLEQNTGVLPRVQPGACLGSYRATTAGRRALGRYRRGEEAEELAA